MIKKQKLSKDEKKDIKVIIDLLREFDHSRDEGANKAREITDQASQFISDVGLRYKERVKNICNNNEDSRACIICMKKYAKNRVVCNSCMDKYKKITLNPLDNFAETVDEMVGGDGYISMGWKDVFSDVFKKHSAEEAEEIFIYGTKNTTPKESDMMSDWPKPWLYGKVFLFFAVSFLISCIIMGMGVYMMAPTVMLIGPMMVPVSMLILFFELNVPRNISIFNVMKIFVIGGLASLYFTAVALVTVAIFYGEELTILGAIETGFREEIAKIIVVFIILKNRAKKGKKNYLLNGLLIGAAVGAGFAVFESAGYAQDNFLSVNILEDGVEVVLTRFEMIFNIILRGIFSPGAHVAWAAMSGFAMVLAGEKKKYKISSLFSRKFIPIFFITVILHSIWDMPIDIFVPCIKELILVILALVALIVLIDNGFDEINIINREKRYM